MHIIRSIPSIFVVSFWVLMMGLLVKKEFVPENISAQKIRFPKELPYIKKWGIYGKTGRIGYLKTKLVSVPIGYAWKNIVKISLPSFDATQGLDLSRDVPVLIRGTAFFDRNEALCDFYIGLRYENYNVNLEGAASGNFLKLRFKTNGSKEEYSFPWLTNSDVVSNGLIPWFYFSGLKVGDKFKWHIINPLTRTKSLVEVTVKRESFYYNKNNFTPVMVVNMYYQDTKFEFWVDNEGNPSKIITPWGWELEAE